MSIHRLCTLLIGLLAALLLAACAGTAVLRDPVPAALVTASAISGYSHIRYRGDDGAAIDTRMIDGIAAQQRASGNMAAERYFLAVSGGGSNGAFGAGITLSEKHESVAHSSPVRHPGESRGPLNKSKRAALLALKEFNGSRLSPG